MPQPEHFDVVLLGSGQGGKQLGWDLAKLRDAVFSHLTMAEGLGFLFATVPERAA